MAQKNALDLDLSLTGSQISAGLSSGKRPRSAQQPKRSSPGIEPRKNKTSSLRERSGSIGELSKRKPSPGLSTPLSSYRSEQSDISSVSKNALSIRGRTKSNDDFLALFENSPQPKIKKPATASTVSNHSKKSLKNSSKLIWDNQTLKGKHITNSSRNKPGPESDRSEPHNIFHPQIDNDSSSEEIEDIEESLSRSINKLQTLQNQLSGINNNATEDAKITKTSPRQSAPVSSGIANNMTSQGLSPKNKGPLSKIEKSYQNINHKAPVNQVPKTSDKHVGLNVAEDYIQSLNTAATKIQKWYRRHDVRQKASSAAVRRLLSQKHKEKIEERNHDVKLSLSEKQIEEKKIEERKKVREEKARIARKQAIQDLQKKREENKEVVKKKAELEISYLQANGKLRKTPSNTSLNSKKKSSPVNPLSPSSSRTEKSEATLTNGNVHSAVDEIFQSGPFSPRSRNSGGAENVTPKSTARKSPSQAATQSTLNDLFDTLRKLEAEEHLVTPRPEKKKNTWMDEITKDDDTDDSKEFNLTAENLSKLGRTKDGLGKSGFLTDDKLKSIITFLDEVQVSDRISVIDSELNKINEDLQKPAILVPDGEEIAHMEQAQAVASEVTNTVLSQRLELDEKKRTVHMLQKALNQQRELTVRHAKETEKEMTKRLDFQKDEYEEAIKRHLSFIDQLIDDKKNLSEKCETLVKELKTVDKKYQDKIKNLDENHSLEISKLKDIHAAAEKLRREKWIEDKTKKIKEMTVKGLEPEIQRLIAKHKSEMKKVKQIHDAELLHADERAAQRYVNMTEELRDQLAKEKEEACRRERELAKERYEKQLQQEELAYQQQRRRLYTEIQEEKDRLSTQGTRQRSDLETLKRQLEDSHRHALDAMKTEFEKSREEQEKRHTGEIQDLQERLKLEKEAWEENYMKKQETWLMQKERELKDNVRRDRDKEIELVISRLEEDATSSREECERTAENRIKRFREKYDCEMRELEKSERQAIQKYNQVKAEMAEVEGENARLKVVIKQKDREIADTKKLIEKLQEERGKVSDIIRQEFADRIVTTEEENKRIKNDISELRAKHRIEIEKTKNLSEEIRKQKDEELDEVHKRVKQAILKKEDVVSQLRQQYQAALKRADHLEGLLEQQRKQLLAGK
ncbi:hypothetical protein SNE40_018889 [Patella caerulea]|uniref:Centrosomal protein of 131 kDa n=1 Tax=Patella caerulea TaxID=87958 RepID=A0AAN8J8L8_PATCE